MAFEIITEAEKGYLAGILDGEGHIAVRLRSKKWLAPVVRVDNTSLSMIQWLHKRYGGCLTMRKEKPPKRDLWIWSVAYSGAKKVLQDALPYLVTKRVHAETLLSIPNFTKLRGTLKPNPGKGFSRSMTADDDILVEDIRNRMFKLNKKGC